jgi:hypothetical protein
MTPKSRIAPKSSRGRPRVLDAVAAVARPFVATHAGVRVEHALRGAVADGVNRDLEAAPVSLDAEGRKGVGVEPRLAAPAGRSS